MTISDTPHRTRPRLVVATFNAKKREELHRILRDRIDVELLSLAEFPSYVEPAETGETFKDNALIKARSAARFTELPTIADDSGLTVAALNGMPGVLSARWAGRARDDNANLQLVLDQITDVPDERRTAAFVCAAALVLPDGREFVAEGQVPGMIIREPRGSHGFGYDPIFVSEGETRTTAELSPTEKDAISHRGRALRALTTDLVSVLGE